MTIAQLHALAQKLVAPRKGILAADESAPTIEKRFRQIDLPSTEANRRDYRELLFRAPGLEAFISGVILFDETIRQNAADGTPFVRLLADRGIVPGIKVDRGAKNLAGFPGEKVTEGLDGLRERLVEYRELGARFAKWRAVITIGSGIPTATCLDANAHGLARYAALCQEAGLVPVVEPEVLMDGDHSIARCFEVTDETLERVFRELHAHRVEARGMLLKTNMVLSGAECPDPAPVDEVARATIRCLRRSVPVDLPGIVFLSGGQSDEAATAHLNAMNRMEPQPWQLSFSYGRALQHPALMRWGGQRENTEAAQSVLEHRARLNGLARDGEYLEKMEQELVG